ncbi:MAG TPA: AmpG family muropeptide MFS transporter [Accumulibacter sp.]|mgnify:CR=1 FL=1|uniref:AmpG family muropeptide MFS transporter n=3 Tax=Candidatus Accumulibacter TaxID=327159 RepID=A0A080MC49_9PROT|nr:MULTISPECIES: AmpG family muropeptide MFS transporter [Candidatus Accumulibacter]KFB70155.1 MAG: muropeptide transporter [Candidatus Accumulibacter vicinus]KFB78030.1 MAG: muropeptide transporter [Candidatus Accumulibacter cognatus]MBL8402346.1 AmpG family muropeptide MFS transporter [Accumulibacter sp.]MBN8518312.1 AmpG family muropeptide MFS transporter [Accumulibacter sp.]MBO3712211.1 AmpG family muropeptide MFS transporter [Accumulibacter sp.]
MPAWLRLLLTRRMLICVFTGFSSGLPLYLLLNLLPAWLRSEGVDLRTIGLFALIQFPYTWKFIWAPLLDRYRLPLGRRRGWMLFSQLGLLLSIGLLGGFSPSGNLTPVIWLSVMLAFLSATQDVALDAFRREILSDQELGLGNSVHVNAYRIAGLVPGSLSLILADLLPWGQVFWITAAFLLPGMVMVLLVSEPAVVGAPKTLRQAVVEPFHEFIGRQGWRGALLVLGFIFLYKLGDSLATALATPFYLDLGFSKTDVGVIAKHAGLWPAVFGGLLGGLWMVRLGINRALWLFGLVQMVTILGFAWLAWRGVQAPVDTLDRAALAAVIAAECLGVGLGTAAFVAFIARATNPAFTATQFALFTSLAAVPRTFINATAGALVESLGWVSFFILCFLLAAPGMLLLLKVAPWNELHPSPRR